MRLLVVAAPMVSRGGVYSWLGDATSILRSAGWTVGVVWAARVEAQAPPADWQRRVVEAGGRLGRVRALPAAVRDAVAAFRPDRVLSVLPQSDLACAQALRGAVPWAAMVHGRPYPARGEGGTARRVAWRAAVRWAYRRADRLLAISDGLAEELSADLGLAGFATVHNGVHVMPQAALRPREGRAVGFLGRLSVEKAPDLFLDAVRDVRCEARVFGDGPLAPTLRAAAAGLDHVAFAGWTEREAALDAIDVLLLPSRREALSLSCLEAGARGIPVLARDVGGVGEVLADPELREHCLLPEQAPPSVFAERLAGLLDDVALRRRLGARLHEVVSTRFALPGQVMRLGELLEGTGGST